MKFLNTGIFFLLFLATNAFAQNGIQFIQTANAHFDKQEYFDAIRWYKEALNQNDGDDAFAYYQLGECHRLLFDYSSAEYNYQKSDELNDPRYPLAKFHFGSMLKINGKYEMALPVYEDFIAGIKNYFEDDPKYRAFYKKAKNEREGCTLALTALSVPKPNYDLKVLGSPVNTDYNDYAPVFVDGENSIQVTSARKAKKGAIIDSSLGEAYSDIYSYSFNGTKWTSNKSKGSVESVVNSKFGEASGVYNKEKTIYYFTYCPELGSKIVCQLYYSKKVKGKWAEPKKLTRNVNAPGTTNKHPALSQSGDTLYFSSDRAGGFGGSDIWMSFSSNGTNWSQPKNLGKEINTPFNEISPFFDPVKKRLFFSSNGHRGFGGYDIFLASGHSFDKNQIYNLGYPFNSNKDDVFAIFGKTKGFLASNRKEGPGKFDVFTFDITDDKAVIAEIAVEQAIAGRNAMFSDDLNFESTEYDLINDLVAVTLAAKLQNIDVILSSVLQDFHNRLSIDDQERVERIVNSRYRKVSEKELNELEIENEYFYATSSEADKKRITSMALKYIEEYGLSNNIDYDDRDNEFLNILDESDKRKVLQVINNRIKKAENFKIETESYDELNNKDKKSVDQIAQLLLKEKKSLDQLSLDINENFFIKSLDEEKKGKVLVSLKDKMLLLAEDESMRLTAEDKVFYNELSKEHLESIKQIANSFLLSDAEHLSQFLAKEDIGYYNLLGQNQKAIVDRIIIKIINNTYKSDLLYTESTEISKAEINLLKNSVTGAGDLNEMLASVNESGATASLDTREKNRILRFLSSGAATSYIKRKENVFTADKAIVEREYNELQQNNPKSTNNKVFNVLFDDETISDVRSSGDTAPTPAHTYTQGLEVDKEPSRSISRLDKATLDFYEGLSFEDQLKIDRFIAARYINKDYESAKILNDDLEFEKNLTKDEKSFVKVLSKNLKEESLNNGEKNVLAKSFVFYNNQAINAKPKWNRLVLSYALEVKSGGSFLAKRKDYAFYGSLSEREKGYVKQIEGFRRSNHRVLTDNIKRDAIDVVPNSLVRNIPEYIVKTEKMSIEGELVDNQDGKAVSSFPVALENESGKQVYQTNTNQQGKFAFKSIDADQYKLVSASEDPKYKEKFKNDYFIKDLKVEEVNNTEEYKIVASTMIFFDTNSKKLRNEAKVSLDEIADAYRRSNFIIEFDSHADEDGNKSYNEILSKDRGFSSKDYLVGKGVKSSDVVMRFFGSEKPVTSNDNVYGKQFNRRVDITLKSKTSINYKPALIYLAKPVANIDDLAKRYNTSVNKLMELNGISERKFVAYKPVRLPNTNVSPDLTQVVPLNLNVLNFTSYVVKSGETIVSIADKLRIPEELIYELNNLTSEEIDVGTTIIVLIRSE